MQQLTHMLTFAEVVRLGSFTAAAQALGISQPLVSRQVSQLESQLGVRLLNRSTRRLHLTEAGTLYYSHCQRIAEEIKAAESAVSPLQQEANGVLRLTAPQCLSQSLLLRVINDFQQQHPNVDVDMDISGRTVDLINEGIDLALRLGELQDSNLVARQLGPATFIVCASQRYWQQYGKPDHPKQLSQHQCLVYSDKPNPQYWLFEEKGDPLKIPVNSRCRSNDAGMLLDLALMDHGIMYAPSFMFHYELLSGRLETALEAFYPPSLGLYAVYPHAKYLAAKTRAFLDFLFSEQAAPYVRELHLKNSTS